MFTLYTFLLTLHVLAAIVWLGSGFMAQVLASRVRHAEGDRLADLLVEVSWYGQRFILGSSLVLVATGLGMVAEGSLDLGETWVLLALIAWVASAATGAMFVGPTSGRIGEALQASRGSVTPEIRALSDRLFLVSRIELVVLVLVVFDMVMKPTWW